MFEIEQFLTDYGIEYVTEGPNTKKGNINIACPWCGDDPSQHLGIEPNKGWYGCWRNPEHRGKNLARLLAAVAPISYGEAARLVGRNATQLSEGDFQAIAEGRFFDSGEVGGAEVDTVRKTLVMPTSFRKLRLDAPTYAAKYYLKYMVSRGFTLREVGRVCTSFNLHYAVGGRFKERIIIPVYLGGDLVTFTARSIYVNAEVPYLSLEADKSLVNIKHCLYNYDSVQTTGGEVLFIVEGPGDVWKLDLFARKHKCRAVGLFNMTCEDEQEEWLDVLTARYKRFVVLTDRNEIVASNALLDKLSYLHMDIKIGELPKGFKDPGQLTKKRADRLCEEYRHAIV